MILLEIKALSVTFPTATGAVQAVRSVDLQIEKGAIHGLIGESGCGKTMTGMALLGLLPKGAQVAAEVFRFDGMDLATQAAYLRGKRIALISQDPAAALNPVLTIGRQMDDVLRTHRTQPKAARQAVAVELLAATGLADPVELLNRYPHQLSGGMQQRVVIAQALATGADFLIADEPTTALDVTVGAQVLALLRKLVSERGLTVLMITHDMDVVAAVCDRATVLYAGLSVEEGPARAIMGRPHHPFSAALLAALPDAVPRGHKLAAIEGRIPSPTQAITGCAFAPRCPSCLPVCPDTPPPVRGNSDHRWACHLDKGAR
ncbi:DppD ABC-type dipeptide/oligopeptide/nickel transport system, ATPase component [Paracoccaceae bacterium]|jgi:oligopeptide/dipeptide ABC transporter ATP-binding protein